MIKESTINEYIRMCKSFETCNDCPLGQKIIPPYKNCRDFMKDFPDSVNIIINKWNEENPIKTKQSELLKIFPNAKLDIQNKVIDICPKSIDKDIKCPPMVMEGFSTCIKCRKDYWLNNY